MTPLSGRRALVTGGGRRSCGVHLRGIARPGRQPVFGDRVTWRQDGGDQGRNPDSDEFADAMRERAALAHYGRPEDIASAVAYLASPEAVFITGISWNVDGGFAA